MYFYIYFLFCAMDLIHVQKIIFACFPVFQFVKDVKKFNGIRYEKTYATQNFNKQIFVLRHDSKPEQLLSLLEFSYTKILNKFMPFSLLNIYFSHYLHFSRFS